jgi:UDP-glucose 4-epimerase/UDP-arabinose 4-epimerase
MINTPGGDKVVLVTGGAGFIGSHTAKALFRNGYRPVVFDNLSAGYRESVRWGDFVHGDIRDRGALGRVMSDYRPSAVIHFAGLIEVGRSVTRPDLFFETNVSGTAALLAAMKDYGVARLVFSSSAAVYGQPAEQGLLKPLGEDAPKAPSSPYGESKLMGERMIEAHCRAFGMTAVALRYFNAAGADAQGELGECHDPETHLIPLAIDAGLGHGKPLTVFGRDFDTPDGSCVRDYVHVEDLAAAHVAALGPGVQTGAFEAMNVGTGRGHSVLEVVAAVDRALATSTLYLVGARRDGDPAYLVADPRKIRERLGWSAPNSVLTRIVETAAAWRRAPKFGGQAPRSAPRIAAGPALAPNVVRLEARGVSEPA